MIRPIQNGINRADSWFESNDVVMLGALCGPNLQDISVQMLGALCGPNLQENYRVRCADLTCMLFEETEMHSDH